MANREYPDLKDRRYLGNGRQHPAPLKGALAEAEPYHAPEDLRRAVNMALYLRRPLLLEGEPGTGKTRLAYAVAYELGYPLKEIYIRSTSRARDLLWTYDAVRRLYDIQERSALAQSRWLAGMVEAGTPASVPGTKGKDTRRVEDHGRYVMLGDLGEAIKLSMAGTPSVVLIDEIDKADIDFPNDLLLVLDRLQFTVDETGRKYDALKAGGRAQRLHYLPLVIITSNHEKELPAPFLRRCLYYYIPFPNPDDIKFIVNKHFDRAITPLFESALRKFWELRAMPWHKAPTTSELLDWLDLLEADERDSRLTAADLAAMPVADLPYLEALLKTEPDRKSIDARRAPSTSVTAT